MRRMRMNPILSSLFFWVNALFLSQIILISNLQAQTLDLGCSTTGLGPYAPVTNCYKVNGGTSIDVAEWVNCKRITNPVGNSPIYVPTKTNGEWSAFLATLPSLPNPVTVTTCTQDPWLATKLAFTVQPSSIGSSGFALATGPTVAVQNYAGTTMTSVAADVMIAAFTDSSCTTPVADLTFTATALTVTSNSGLSAFSGVTYTGSGTIYLQASAAGLTSACSSAITMTPPVLEFTTQPSTPTTAGVIFSTQPSVSIKTSAGGSVITSATDAVQFNAYTDSNCTTLASGTLTAVDISPNAVSGVATPVSLTYSISGTIYIGASSGVMTPACSSAVTMNASTAYKIAFSTQPSGTASAGTNFTTQPAVQIRDSGGATVTTANNAVSIAAYTNNTCTTPATLGVLGVTQNSKSAASGTGIATFSGVNYTGIETIYLGATSPGLRNSAGTVDGVECSTAIVVSLGSAAKLSFTAFSGGSENPMVDFGIQPEVSVLDAGGNVVTTATNSITLSVYSDSACTVAASGTMTVTTNPLAATSGVALFAGVNYSIPGTIYIKATASGLTSVCSDPVVVAAGAPTQLLFTTQPSSTANAGSVISTQPQVSILDAKGFINTTASDTVTLSMYSDSTCTTAVSGLSVSTNPVPTASGVATFSGVTLNLAGTVYLKATSAAGLTSDCSSAITVIVGAPTKLAFTQDPARLANPTVNLSQMPTVAVQDFYGNTVTSATNAVTLAAYADSTCTTTLASGGTLSATTNPVSASSGVATFAGVKYSTADTIYIKASATGLTSACSPSILVDYNIATQLSFFTQPSTTGTAGTNLAQQPVIEVQDGNGVRRTTGTYATSAITLVAYTDSTCTTTLATGTLNGASMSATAGLATYTGLNYTKAESIYLKATSGLLTSACSSIITVSPGTATKLGFTTQPSPYAKYGVALAVQPVVKVYDAYDNIVTSGSKSITLASYSNSTCTTTATGTLSVTTNPVSSTSGIATFAGVKHGTLPEQIYIRASATGLTSACSNIVYIGLNLEVPIELFDLGLASISTASKVFEKSRTSLDPTQYDGYSSTTYPTSGASSYAFEAVCTNSDNTARTVSLVDSATTPNVKASISIPSGTTAVKRFETTFTPNAPADTYRVKLDQTNVASQLKCYAGRIKVKQLGASKTRIYVPLTAGKYNAANSNDGDAASPIAGEDYVGKETSTSFPTTPGNSTDMYYTIIRDDMKSTTYFSTVGNLILEAIVSGSGGTPSVELLDTTASTTGGVKSGTSGQSIGLIQSTAFAAIGSSSSESLEVRLKTSAGTSYLYKAGLWVNISAITKTLSYYRIGNAGTFSATTTNPYQRNKITTANFSTAAVRYSVTNTQSTASNYTVGTISDAADTGTVTTTVGTAINTNNTVKTRSRSTVTLTSGRNYYPVITKSTSGTTNMSSGIMNVNGY